jgi:four helix bundle protein
VSDDDLKARTKAFALRVMKLVASLPRSTEGRVIGYQLCKAGTSVAANYRAACRARSKAEFIAKIGVVLEEADESALWLELIIDGKILPKTKVSALWQEAEELTAIMAQSRKTAQNRNKAQK